MASAFPPDAVAHEPIHWQPRWIRQLLDHPSGLRWHADGRRLAAASLGGDTIVYEASSGEMVDHTARQAGALGVTWAGEYLVAGYDDGTVTIDGQPIRLRGWIHDLAVSSQHIAVAHGRSASVLGLDVGSSERTVTHIAEHPTSITSTAWHPDGSKILLGSHNRLEWVTVSTLDSDPVPTLWGGAITSLRGGRDHDWWVAGVRGDWSYTWRLADPTVVHVLPVPRATGKLVAVDPTHARCVIASPQMTALFDMDHADDDGQPSGQWLFALGVPSSVTWHPHRPVLLCGVAVDGDASRAGILRWEPDRDPVPLGCLLTPERVAELAWSPDGSLLAVGLADGTVAVLDADHAAP